MIFEAMTRREARRRRRAFKAACWVVLVAWAGWLAVSTIGVWGLLWR